MNARFPIAVGFCVVVVAIIGICALLGSVGVIPTETILRLLGGVGGFSMELEESAGWADIRLALIGLCFLATGIMGLVSFFPCRKASGRIRIQGKGGPIFIENRGIEEFILRTIRQMAGVQSARARVEAEGESVRVRITTDLSVPGSVPDMIADMQQKVHRELQVTLGLPKIGEVEVSVGRMTRQPSPSDGDSSPSSPDPPYSP